MFLKVPDPCFSFLRGSDTASVPEVSKYFFLITNIVVFGFGDLAYTRYREATLEDISV